MQATTPASVNHVPAWLVVASALRSLLIRFSTPTTTKKAQVSHEVAHGRALAHPVPARQTGFARQPRK